MAKGENDDIPSIDREPGRSLLAQALVEKEFLATAMADGHVGVFCGMGACFQCEEEVAGTVVRTCLVRVAP